MLFFKERNQSYNLFIMAIFRYFLRLSVSIQISMTSTMLLCKDKIWSRW